MRSAEEQERTSPAAAGRITAAHPQKEESPMRESAAKSSRPAVPEPPAGRALRGAATPGARRGERSPEPAERDLSISVPRANAVALLLLPLIAALVLAPFTALWGLEALDQGWMDAATPFWRFLAWLVASVVAHEALHALGFLLGGAPASTVRLGIHPRALTPFASCSQPVSPSVYRMAAVLPAVVLGVAPMLLAWISGVGWLAVYAFGMLAAAAGDLTVLWLVRGLPRDARVLDNADRAGCRVVAQGQL